MSDDAPQAPAPESVGDLEYDLAHEALEAAKPSIPAPVTPSIEPVTRKGDYHGGDYSYDLAHDIPQS